MNAEGPALATTRGVAADNAVISARRRGALVSTALRTRSVHAREILAEAAWPGHSAEQVEGWFSRGVDAPRNAPDPPPGSDPRRIADYARVLAVQFGDDAERRCAHAMLECLARTRWSLLKREQVELLAELRVLSGEVDAALEAVADPQVREGVRSTVRADALHPRLAPGADLVAWAQAFSAALHSDRLAPFLPPPAGNLPHLDELRVESRKAVPAPLRVTVMMSTYRPGPALRTAVSSVLAQTWTNLELFVVDDASGPGPEGEWSAVLDEVQGMDDRVRVVRKAVNGGTYRARNTILRQASGDLAIVLDSDDWWHPQTLEVCAGPLLDSSLMATRAQGVRVTPDLVLTRPGYLPRFQSAATVLFRLRPVVSRLGFFDPTRKGADTEYTRRMLASFGSVLRDIPETTTILRAGGATLSAEEFSNGWRHPARHQYKSLYTPWHSQIAGGKADPYLDPEQPRRFPEPLRWSRATHPLLAQDRRVDLCLAGDWRRYGGPQRSMLEEIRAAREAGLRVGVMHLEAGRFMTPKDDTLCEPVLDLVRRGEVVWVLPDDDVDIDVLLVRYPPILQYPPHLERRVRASNVLVMANQGPVEPDGSDERYVVRDVSARAAELFGRPVTWVPQSPTIRKVLLEQDPGVHLTDWDNPGLIDLDAWSVRPSDPPSTVEGRPIVVGRHSRDSRIKFPQTYDELLRGYSFPDGYAVRMLGADGTIERLREAAGETAAPLPANWTLLPHDTQDVRAFLAGLDFYLYLDNPQAHEAFGRTLLEAAASGVLTIAHPKHRLTFGDVLDYAEPGAAQELIAHYVANPTDYQARVAATRTEIARRYGHAGFVDQLRPLLASAAAPDRQQPPLAGQSTPAPTSSEVHLRWVDDQAGVQLPGLGGVLPTQADGARLEVLPLRSAADGERADAALIVHDDLPASTLRPWLHRHLAGTTSPTWSPTQLVAAAPAGVAVVLVARDGLVLAAGRGDWEGAETDDALVRLAGGPTTKGWAHLAWTTTRPPGDLVLRRHPISTPRHDATAD